jgi:hypothetical protein
VRDFLLTEALKRLATEAATRLSSLVAGGEEIPFDVGTGSGEDSPFYSYVPLTRRYVTEHADELRALPGFAAAREAVVEAGIAAPYLESRGEVVPPDPGARAELMLITFFAALWDGSSGFALERGRLEEALALLEAEGRDADDADVLIVPIVGLRMSMPRLSLPNGVRVVRSDSIESPVEAMSSEGMGRAAWEPQFLAVADQAPEEGAEEALLQLRELISVMRLFKAGGIGLGPYAFAPTGGAGVWRRVATGAPATRPGGYRLTEPEAEELAAFARALESRPDPDLALAWAVGRFEMGCERESALQGLSDLLLAMRAVLEGHGPVGATLPMRAAALMAAAEEAVDRIESRERIEAALELERAMMNGRPLGGAIELATWIEESTRGLLRQAALGELGADLGVAADETLIAAGLAEGDAEITVSVETPADAPEDLRPSHGASGAPGHGGERSPELEGPSGMPGGEAEDMPADSRTSPAPDSDRGLTPSGSGAGPDESSWEAAAAPAEPPRGARQFNQQEDDMQETRIMEPIPAEDEIKITATPWLEEVSEGAPGESLEWPAPEVARDLQHRERIDTPRVRHLFPVPDSDWEVSHLEYEHYGRDAS